MRFNLLDRIIDFQEGESITAVKGLSLAEEYLQDHFPRFPVMPGVLMLEAMYQASAWLIRKGDDFEHPVVLLKEARNVKFQDFVRPGQQLTVTAKVVRDEEKITTLKTQGSIDDQVAVSGRLVLERSTLAVHDQRFATSDEFARSELRKTFDLLYQQPIRS